MYPQIRVMVEKINAPGEVERLDTHAGELPLSEERVREIAYAVGDKLSKHSAIADANASAGEDVTGTPDGA